MSKYDNVGVCLSKEIIKPKPTATNTLNPLTFNQGTPSATPTSGLMRDTPPPPVISRMKQSIVPPPPPLLGNKVKKNKDVKDV